MKEELFGLVMLHVDIGYNTNNDKTRLYTIFTNTLYELVNVYNEFSKYPHLLKRLEMVPFFSFDSDKIYRGVFGPLKKFRYSFKKEDLDNGCKKLHNIYRGRYYLFINVYYDYDNLEQVCDILINTMNSLNIKLVDRRDMSSVICLNKENIKSFLIHQ